MTQLSRRGLLGKGALAAAGAATLATPAIAQDKIKLRMVTSWPKNFPGLGSAAISFAERVKKASDGRINIEVLSGGELVGALKVHDAVQEGTADMYHSCDYYFQGKQKGLAFFTTIPFGMTTNEINAWILHGGGQKIWDEVNADFNIKNLIVGNIGSQMGGWFRDPITSLNDFKGLKMRIPGIGGDVIKGLGGTPITIPGSEIGPALQAGTIDATEFAGPWNDLAFGLYKVAKNYHFPGFHEPGAVVTLGLNKTVWDGMSETDKAIFENCALAETTNNAAEYMAENARSLNTLVNEHGVNLIEFPDEVYQEVGKIMPDLVSSFAAADPTTKKVIESYTKFADLITKWSQISDGGYYAKRKG